MALSAASHSTRHNCLDCGAATTGLRCHHCWTIHNELGEGDFPPGWQGCQRCGDGVPSGVSVCLECQDEQSPLRPYRDAVLVMDRAMPAMRRVRR